MITTSNSTPAGRCCYCDHAYFTSTGGAPRCGLYDTVAHDGFCIHFKRKDDRFPAPPLNFTCYTQEKHDPVVSIPKETPKKSCFSCKHCISTFPKEDKWAHARGWPTTGCLWCEKHNTGTLTPCQDYVRRPDGEKQKVIYT